MTPPRPNFLIAGAENGGTMSLHDYLGQHLSIFMSTFKEPNFFVHGYSYEDWNDYLALFSGAHGETALNTRTGSTPQHNTETEAELLEHYREDTRQFEQILERDFSFWFNQQVLSKASFASDYVSVH